MKIVTILGTRPQFIKSIAVSQAIDSCGRIEEVIVDTGQHFDADMSEVFIKELMNRRPKYCLNINSLSHGAMTGQMLEGIEEVLVKERPEAVLVYGDTNSTLAGALAAKKLHIKTAHIEAGLRSFDMSMPEEINRVLTDRISDILFCPTDRAVRNLKNEGFGNSKCKIIKSGDVMKDVAQYYGSFSKKPEFNIPAKFILVTIHRAANTDNREKLESIIQALNRLSEEVEVVFPIHPRTRNAIAKSNIKVGFELIDPVGYLEMIYLLQNCRLVMTDSGGVQKESFFFKKPCIVLRSETEWVELIEAGVAVLTGTNVEKIYESYKEMMVADFEFDLNLYGEAKASDIIVKQLLQ